MKLRNKKTGEIGEPRIEYQEIYINTENHMTYCYKTLRGVFEEWEDDEEPRRHWIIDTMNDRVKDFDVPMDFNESIGNYFSSREEAEKAVEKLKAWKRLEDKGFKAFSSSICGDDFIVNFKLTNHVDYSQSMDDFDCIFGFGGEE